MLIIRKIKFEDSTEVLRWRNDPSTVKNSSSERKVDLHEHIKWMSSVVDSDKHYVYIGLKFNKLIGLVKFSKLDSENTFELSINLAPEMRSMGFGKNLLKISEKKLVSDFGKCSLIAKVLKNNQSSISLFHKSQYRIFTDDQKHFYFKKNLI